MVIVEYAYGYSEKVSTPDEARRKIAESAVENTTEYPLRWERDKWGEKATQEHPYFTGERRFVGRIYSQ